MNMSTPSQSSINSSTTPLPPHYAQPNITSQLPSYSNTEQEIIIQTFSKTSFNRIQNLPNIIHTNYVNEAKHIHIDNNLTSALPVKPYNTYKRLVGGTFSDYPVEPEPEVYIDAAATQNRLRNIDKRLQISNKPFSYSSANPTELVSRNYDENNYYSQLLSTEAVKSAENRKKILTEMNILPPFKPTNPQSTTMDSGIRNDSILNRSLLPDIIHELMISIDSDFNETEFEIYSDPQDMIIIQFLATTLDSPKGLLAYLNQFMKTNLTVLKYSLSKLPELWNHADNSLGLIYYAIKPAWVKRSITASYYAIHPERRNWKSTKKLIDQEKQIIEEEKQNNNNNNLNNNIQNINNDYVLYKRTPLQDQVDRFLNLDKLKSNSSAPITNNRIN